MARDKVIAEELQLDALDETCLALEIEEDRCQILREAAQEVYSKKAKGKRGKREISPYQKFVSECMTDKKIKKFEEASSAMKECAAEWNKKKSKS